MDKTDFSALWATLTAAYPNFQTPAATIEVYHRALSDVDFRLAEAAMLDCITKCRFFPTVAEIREAAARLAAGADARTPALEAWGHVKQAVSSFGRHGFDAAAEWLEPQTAETIRALGWAAFCDSDIDDEMSWRARFVELYDQYGRRAVRNFQMLPAVKEVQAERIEAMRQIAARLAAPRTANDA